MASKVNPERKRQRFSPEFKKRWGQVLQDNIRMLSKRDQYPLITVKEKPGQRGIVASISKKSSLTQFFGYVFGVKNIGTQTA